MANDDLEDKDKVPLTPEGMAAEWATMSDIIEDDGSEAEANIDRLMNQEEIDTMLGFSIGDDGKGDQGIGDQGDGHGLVSLIRSG